jgi:antitoxin (DNA-binding transcriptional repressor) of toxin-antitoxin stability system
VRAGEELVIRDRNLPIAKIVPLKKSPKIAKAIRQAIAADRKDYAGLLGHKRDHSHLHTRAKRQGSQASPESARARVWWTAGVEVRSVLERLRKGRGD